jgi:hypothetical protein
VFFGSIFFPALAVVKKSLTTELETKEKSSNFYSLRLPTAGRAFLLCSLPRRIAGRFINLFTQRRRACLPQAARKGNDLYLLFAIFQFSNKSFFTHLEQISTARTASTE